MIITDINRIQRVKIDDATGDFTPVTEDQVAEIEAIIRGR